MAEKLWRALPALLGLILFGAALVALRKELDAVTWHELTSGVLAVPITRILAALLLTSLVALAGGRSLLAGVRRLQQHGLRHVLGRRRALPHLHALGRCRAGGALLVHLLRWGRERGYG